MIIAEGGVGWSEHVAKPVGNVKDNERQRKQLARQSVDVVRASLLHRHDATLEFADWIGD